MTSGSTGSDPIGHSVKKGTRRDSCTTTGRPDQTAALTRRVKAIEGLARLALAEDRALFERLKGDDDLHVSEAAMKALVSLEGR